MDDRTAYSMWLGSFVAGALVGAGVTLLLAPRSGRATREASRRALRDAAETVRGLKHRVSRRSEDLRDEVARRTAGVASALAGKQD